MWKLHRPGKLILREWERNRIQGEWQDPMGTLAFSLPSKLQIWGRISKPGHNSDQISAERVAGVWQNRPVPTLVPTALGSSRSPKQGNGCFLCIQCSIVEQCLRSQGIAFWSPVGQKNGISRSFSSDHLTEMTSSGKKSQKLEALLCCANGTHFYQEEATGTRSRYFSSRRLKSFPKEYTLAKNKDWGCLVCW